eukprot:SAG11_NODE_17763_length_509_cov_1.626829_1_plen_40_part_00
MWVVLNLVVLVDSKLLLGLAFPATSYYRVVASSLSTCIY